MNLKKFIFIAFIALYLLDVWIVTPYGISNFSDEGVVEQGLLPLYFYNTFGIVGFYIFGLMMLGIWTSMYLAIKNEKLNLSVFSMCLGIIITILSNNFRVIGEVLA